LSPLDWLLHRLSSYADTNNNGQIGNDELINHTYLSVFGRAPDQAGFTWWKNELDSGNKTQSQAFIEMNQSNEYVQQTVPVVVDMIFM